MKSIQNLKTEIYQKLTFTPKEIADGEKLYASLKTSDEKNNFADIYYVYLKRRGNIPIKKTVYEINIIDTSQK